jgi:2-polyprenyl-6-methoxyphenol hydroxylase-like FAD-dependent oxidoreductase
VRELADISFANPFNGEPYHIPHSEAIERQVQYLVLSDVVLEGSYPSTFLRDRLSMIIDPSGMLLLIPLPLPDDIHQRGAEGLTFWRVVFPITIKNELPPAKPDLADIQRYFDQRRGIWEEKDWPKVLEVRESSRYRVREAMASTMYKPFGTHGHVLLVGDAAHVHSPAGGQGAFPRLSSPELDGVID